MIRRVEFTDAGDIVISGELGSDVIKSGVVMLTKEQAEQAACYGWRIEGEPETATVPPLYRVTRT